MPSFKTAISMTSNILGFFKLWQSQHVLCEQACHHMHKHLLLPSVTGLACLALSCTVLRCIVTLRSMRWDLLEAVVCHVYVSLGAVAPWQIFFLLLRRYVVMWWWQNMDVLVTLQIPLKRIDRTLISALSCLSSTMCMCQIICHETSLQFLLLFWPCTFSF